MADTFKVSREDLVSAVELLGKVPVTSSMPCSEIIKLSYKGDKLFMQLTSDAAALVYVMGEGQFPVKEFFIDRDVFIPFVLVGKKNQSAFFFMHAKGKLTIKQGTRRVACSSEAETSGYGAAKPDGDATEVDLSPATFRMVAAAQVISGKNEAEPELTCVFLDGKGHLLATDGLLMIYAAVDHKGAVVPIPHAAVSLAATANKIHVGKSLTMIFEAGRITHPIPADALGAYPVDMFTAQLKALKHYPVQVGTTVGKFETLVANVAGAGAKMNKKGTFLKIQYSKPRGVRSTNPVFAVSMYIKEKEAMVSDRSLPTTKTSTTDDTPLLLPVARLLDVAKLFQDIYDDKQELTISWTATSPVCVIRSGKTIVIMARIVEG